MGQSNIKKYRCPVCENAPNVNVDGGITTISCCGIRVHSVYFFSAISNWKRLYKMFSSLEEK